MARRLLNNGSSGAHWLLGPVWGVACATLGLLVLWLLGFHAAWILIAAPWPLWLLLLLPLERSGIRWPLPMIDRRDVLAVSLVLLIVPIVAGMPYHNVAAPTPDGGKAYRAYFTADFVWAMTTVAEVSKGDVPPKNPFLPDQALNYYWLSHFLSAVEYRTLAPHGIAIEEITLAGSIGYSAFFVVFLYGFIRILGPLPLAAGLACGLVFLANSYEALDRAWAWRNDPALGSLMRDLNIDAVTRWFYSGMPVDGLHRMILYQPHHLAGYALGLSALALVARTADVSRPFVALAAGMFLGASLLFSSFTAIIIGVALSIVYAVRLVTARQWTAMPICAVLGAAPVMAAVAASSALAYVAPSGKTILFFGPNPVALSHWPYALLLSFGPLLILGSVGAAVAAWRRVHMWPVCVLAVVALAFYFLTDVPDMEHVWVGWRAGHLLFIASAVLAAVLFQEIIITQPRAEALVAASVVALLAVPTTAIDIYNAQDVSNHGQGPSFPWTLVLSRDEVDALQWLKLNTARAAVVQADTRVRDSASWGYITAFGERRMAAGLPIAMIPMQPYRDATEAVGELIFTTGTAEARWTEAHTRGIQYLYVGPAEQAAHADLLDVLRSRPDLFLEAYRNGSVVIFRIANVNVSLVARGPR